MAATPMVSKADIVNAVLQAFERAQAGASPSTGSESRDGAA
jgi:hypothetical protein